MTDRLRSLNYGARRGVGQGTVKQAKPDELCLPFQFDRPFVSIEFRHLSQITRSLLPKSERNCCRS
jgi:hypothetical protein